jgi:hypothetical protein
MPPAIKEAKSKMDKFTANGYASWIKGKTDAYPITKHIYREYGTWNKMKKEVFDNPKIYRENNWTGTKDEAVEKLREVIPFVEKVTLKRVQEYCETFPSQKYISDKFGNWTNMKRLAAGDELTFSGKPKFCNNCDIGRCRFDYNLEECEYYEGE